MTIKMAERAQQMRSETPEREVEYRTEETDPKNKMRGSSRMVGRRIMS